MRHIQHSTNNGVLGAPKGWKQDELPCSALPVTHVDDEHGHSIVSFWKPTPEEIAQLMDGASIALWVIGRTMPPVALAVQSA